MADLQARFGASGGADLLLQPGSVYALSLDWITAADGAFAAGSGPAAGLDLFSLADGADDQAGFPGALAAPDDPAAPWTIQGGLQAADNGSFVFAMEFDGGENDRFGGMAYQDPAAVDVTGGTLSNVLLINVTVDGGEF